MIRCSVGKLWSAIASLRHWVRVAGLVMLSINPTWLAPCAVLLIWAETKFVTS
jgi:hypothetical protein